MADTGSMFHPRLKEDGTLAPSQEVTLEEATPPSLVIETLPEATTPAETETAPVTEAPPPPDETNVIGVASDDGFYKISKTTAYQDIRRLAQEDPDFNRRIMEYAGRRQRWETQETINNLRAELAAKERELKRRDMQALSPEEIEERVAKDEAFAKDYVEFLHSKDDADADPAFESEVTYYEMARDDLFDEARGANIPDWVIKQYGDAFHYCPAHRTDEHGFYDHDERGVFFEQRFKDPAVARKASFDYFQKLLNQQIRAVAQVTARPQQTPPPPPPAQKQPEAPAPPAASGTERVQSEVGKANANLSAMSPDLSPRSGVSSQKARYTDDDLRSMPVDKRIALVESFGGRRKMIEDGILYVPGLSEEVLGTATVKR